MPRDESCRTIFDRGSCVSPPNIWSVSAWRMKEEGEVPLTGRVCNFLLCSIQLGEDMVRYYNSLDANTDP